ncbi:polysaccharide deacetylase family protein [Empedobacter sedimenti]|uniref:polysaccharide deacetylase family protein n=1 Tax=Empedobacter sedimenti TaxID=3042610 RepID=UPI0024A710BA|nr:polysaccharide deacetylase family protein [Empedobacter sedimenti]
MSFLYLLLPVFIWLSLTIFGAFEIRLNYFLKAYHRGENDSEKIISLTFDDGPTEFTPRVLEILEKNNAKATFFCIGKQIENYPEILQRTHQSGHLIGNHTFHHSSKNGFYSTEKIIDEIISTNQLIKEEIKITTKLFRPPFGVTNPHIAKALEKTKHYVIGWNIRSLDTVIEDEKQLLTRIKRQIKPGSIILLHDTSDKTANVLEQLFVFLQKENYKVVLLDELLKIDVYEN